MWRHHGNGRAKRRLTREGGNPPAGLDRIARFANQSAPRPHRGIEVGRHEGKPPEASRRGGVTGLARPGRGLDDLEDHLTHPEERLARRATAGRALTAAAQLEPRALERPNGAVEVRREGHDVIDGLDAVAVAGSDARRGSPDTRTREAVEVALERRRQVPPEDSAAGPSTLKPYSDGSEANVAVGHGEPRSGPRRGLGGHIEAHQVCGGGGDRPIVHHARVDRAVSVRAPLRISLGGGGTDLPSYYRSHGGFVLSAAIDRYIRVRVSPAAGARYHLDHLEVEDVAEPGAIAHPILRAAIVRHWRGGPIDLVSRGAVAPGTGLGSSGSYTAAAIKALVVAGRSDLEPSELAEAASEIELGDLGRTVGKQDQYAAAHGGVNAFTFDRDDGVEVRRLELGADTRTALRERFLLFGAGGGRSAADILAGQVERTVAGDPGLRRNLARSQELAHEACAALEAGAPDRLGPLMEEQWSLKRDRLADVQMQPIEELRALALAAGAHGATLVGAGGGGYLLVSSPEPGPVRAAFAAAGVPELTFDLDHHGCVEE